VPVRPRITYSTALVLAAVARHFRYGFDISDVTGLPSGTVYPVLRRLEDAGLLRSRWEGIALARAEQRPARRYYTLTESGAEVARDAMARYPGLEAALERPGTAPRPRPA
jgi:DNA-binding PadR family transcriptional regulator